MTDEIAQCGNCGHNNFMRLHKPDWLPIAVPYYKCSHCNHEFYTHDQSLIVDYIRVLRRDNNDLMDCLKKLVFMARTTGGVSGTDEHLCEALDASESVISEIGRRME